MRFVGLDIALATSGVAVLDYETGELLDAGLIRTPPGGTIFDRCAAIAAAVSEVLERHTVDFRIDVAIEDGIALRSGTTTRHLAMAWFAAAQAVVDHNGYPPAVFNVAQVKARATGNGAAKKAEVIEAAVRRWPGLPAQSDMADAAWVAELGREQLIVAVERHEQEQLTKEDQG